MKRYLVFLGFLMLCAPGFSQESPIPLVIFPYGSPDSQVQESQGYALFTVPDLLREKLAASGKFLFVEFPEEARSLGSDVRAEAGRLEAARTSGADYLVWGYLVSSSTGFKVVHKVVETRSGAVAKILSQDLPGGIQIIDAMDRSVLDLAEGLNRELAPLPPRVITVEKVVIKEVPSEEPRSEGTTREPQAGQPEPVVALPASDFALAAGLTGFLGQYAGVLAGTLYLKAEITHPLNPQGTWDWGADLMIHGLKPSSEAVLPEDQIPDLAYVPMLLKTSWRWAPWGFLHLGGELKAGGALLIGTYGGASFLAVRPSWSAGVMVELWPGQSLGLRFQMDHLGTFIDWGKNYLQTLRLGVGFRFDV